MIKTLPKTWGMVADWGYGRAGLWWTGSFCFWYRRGGMDIAVVNLERRADRRAQFTAWNARPGLDLRFVPAAEGAKLSRAAMREEGVLAADDQRFNDGALGCAVSHRRLWQEVVAAGKPLIVCEDDCCLRADFVQAVPALAAQLPAQWDLVYLAYNTNASVAVESGEGLKTVLIFSDGAKQTPGFFDHYARGGTALAPSTLLRCFQAWGTLCYYVSPSGAAKLLRHCFPMTAARPIAMFGQQRTLAPFGIDGMMNLALQREPINAFCAYPPLAMSPHVDSDIKG